MTEIARKAGVAKSTVSLALRNSPRVTEASRLHIQQIAAEMGYHTNALVAQLMAELRREKKQSYVATLALVNLSKFENLDQLVSSVAGMLKGTQQRAQQLGYQLDRFWINEPEITPARLAKILHARNIQGIVFFGIRDDALLQQCEPLWGKLPTVVLGHPPSQPALNFVTNDHYRTAAKACARLRAAGYKRIGIVLDRWLDNILEHRLIAGYLTDVIAQKQNPLLLYLDDPRENPRPEGKKRFTDWMKKHQPDSCICINSFILDWVKELGLTTPDKMGVALLDVPNELRNRAAGMYTDPTWLGMKAVEVLISQIHCREAGIPKFQSGQFIEGQWMDGPSVRAV